MKTKPKVISISEFKAKCLRILEQLEPQGVLVTKRGQPIARVLPAGPDDTRALIGSMAGRIVVRGDILSTGEQWDAEPRHAHSNRNPKRRSE